MNPGLSKLIEDATREADAFETRHAQRLDAYRQAIAQGVESAVNTLHEDVRALSAGDPLCDTMMQLATEYVLWLRWTLFDLPRYAIVFETPLATFRERVTATALIYQSIRILDDVLDTHLTYKDLHSTLLGSATEKLTGNDASSSDLPTNLSLLTSVLLSVEGLRRLANLCKDGGPSVLIEVLEAYRKTVVGAILEYSPHSSPTTHYLVRLVDLKNVSYSRILIAALSVDKEKHQMLLAWIDELYVLSQQLNDLNDLRRDVASGQPNFIWEMLKERQLMHAIDASPDRIRDRAAIAAVEDFYGEAFLKLGSKAYTLPGDARAVAMLKWRDAIGYARFLGLFPDDSEQEATGIRIT